jgi:hypothetical protein
MKTFRFSFLPLALAVVALIPTAATTVIPPSFDELVEQAQLIFQGTVTDVQSQWTGEGAQRRIVSYVTFRVEESIKHEAGASYTLRMLGGTVNGETMGIADAPLFKKGDRDILFVENNGSQFVPLVGIMYGRFRLVHDRGTGREIVTTNTGEPVTDLTELGKDKSAEDLHSRRSDLAGALEGAFEAAAFKAAIRVKLRTADR